VSVDREQIARDLEQFVDAVRQDFGPSVAFRCIRVGRRQRIRAAARARKARRGWR